MKHIVLYMSKNIQLQQIIIDAVIVEFRGYKLSRKRMRKRGKGHQFLPPGTYDNAARMNTVSRLDSRKLIYKPIHLLLFRRR